MKTIISEYKREYAVDVSERKDILVKAMDRAQKAITEGELSDEDANFIKQSVDCDEVAIGTVLKKELIFDLVWEAQYAQRRKDKSPADYAAFSDSLRAIVAVLGAIYSCIWSWWQEYNENK